MMLKVNKTLWCLNLFPSINTFFKYKRQTELLLLLKTYYVRQLVEDKAKGQPTRNLRRTQSINKSSIFLIYFLQNVFLSISCSSTSPLSRSSSELMPELCYNGTLVSPSPIQQINARQIFLKYQILLQYKTSPLY